MTCATCPCRDGLAMVISCCWMKRLHQLVDASKLWKPCLRATPTAAVVISCLINHDRSALIVNTSILCPWRNARFSPSFIKKLLILKSRLYRQKLGLDFAPCVAVESLQGHLGGSCHGAKARAWVCLRAAGEGGEGAMWGGGREREHEKGRARECVCACACVCV